MKVLLIRPGAIGDCLLWLPLVQFLRRDWTTVWISSPLVPLVRNVDEVRALSSTQLGLLGLEGLEPPQALIAQLRSFDLIVSWYGANRPSFISALEGTGVPCVFHKALPHPDWEGSVTDFYAKQIGAPQGLVPSLSPGGTGKVTQRNTIVIQPFSGSGNKNWPLRFYRELAEQLRLPVEWLAGPEEELEGAIRIPQLDQLAKWIGAAKLYVGNDSGITHLAAMMGVPTLALFGPASPKCWQPVSANAETLRTDDLNELSVAAVLAAANRLLGS